MPEEQWMAAQKGCGICPRFLQVCVACMFTPIVASHSQAVAMEPTAEMLGPETLAERHLRRHPRLMHQLGADMGTQTKIAFMHPDPLALREEHHGSLAEFVVGSFGASDPEALVPAAAALRRELSPPAPSSEMPLRRPPMAKISAMASSTGNAIFNATFNTSALATDTRRQFVLFRLHPVSLLQLVTSMIEAPAKKSGRGQSVGMVVGGILGAGLLYFAWTQYKQRRTAPLPSRFQEIPKSNADSESWKLSRSRQNYSKAVMQHAALTDSEDGDGEVDPNKSVRNADSSSSNAHPARSSRGKSSPPKTEPPTTRASRARAGPSSLDE
mmetsp:Transcript_48552/g.135688  ORF Transcript_48552/g.135688 Transcript_48552/m.135688 type:complete len:327 (+) Transcript_48552:167-1147(+)